MMAKPALVVARMSSHTYLWGVLLVSDGYIMISFRIRQHMSMARVNVSISTKARLDCACGGRRGVHFVAVLLDCS